MTTVESSAPPVGPPADAPTANLAVPILMVDDNPAKRLALRSVLSPLGYDIVEAGSGIEALRCVMARNYAVILLDVMMPGMGGFETAALLRQRRQTEMTPIIFITAHAKDEIGAGDLYAEGAVDFMFAPVPPSELRAKVSVFANIFINAEKLAKQAQVVQTSVDELRLLTEAAPIGIFQTDTHNRYVYTNPRWTEITGMSAEQAVGRDWDAIMGLEQGAVVAADLQTGTEFAAELSHRFEIRVDPGTTRVVLLTSKPIPDQHGGTAGWVGTLADITAEAGAEAAMSDARDKATEASRLKSDFLANMSHEIRTPMNGVIGMADLLLETDLDVPQRDYAQTVRNSGEALLCIIDDILDFSKIEAGKLEVESVGFRMETIVDDVVHLLAGQAQAKGLDLIAVIEPTLPAVVNGDPGRLRQVLTNLIGNAIKFTQSGEVVVRVSEAAAGTDGIVRFEVADTGDGIAADKLDEVFQPFVQADSSTSRKYGGAGLGLSISAQLVALMGGTYGVSSEVGVGSTFWFTIAAAADALNVPPARLVDTDLDGVRVLVVDDSQTQRDMLAGWLADWGMTVDAVDSAGAAIDSIRHSVGEGQPFSVALLDQRMPEMDGLALAGALVEDAALAVPAVLMTDLGKGASVGAAAASGIHASLSKPIHPEELKLCLRIALGLAVADPVASEDSLSDDLATDEFATGRLLLAEDNAVNQKVAVAMVSSAGYRVDTVITGTAAVQAAATGVYDAILMDCQMPELTGYEATVAIRADEGSARHTPIIAMTAGAQMQDRARCMSAGMDGYLAKPVSKEALLGLLDRFVGTRKQPAVRGSRVHPPAAKAATVDTAVFGKLRELSQRAGPAFLPDLVDAFVTSTDLRLVELNDAIVDGDTTAVAQISHSVKGSSSQLGGRRLAASCSELETKGAAGDLSGARAHLHKIDRDYRYLRAALAEELAVDAAAAACVAADRTGTPR